MSGAVFGGLAAFAGVVLTIAWTQFWNIHENLHRTLRKDLRLAQGVVWGSRFAPALARLFVDLYKETHEGNSISGGDEGEEDDDARIRRVANRITRKDYFERVEEAYGLGLTATMMEARYEQLGRDGAWAFWGLVTFALTLPPSALFALVPGAKSHDAGWVAAVTAWSTLLALVFCVAGFYVARFYLRRAELIRMLDEYEE